MESLLEFRSLGSVARLGKQWTGWLGSCHSTTFWDLIPLFDLMWIQCFKAKPEAPWEFLLMGKVVINGDSWNVSVEQRPRGLGIGHSSSPCDLGQALFLS